MEALSAGCTEFPVNRLPPPPGGGLFKGVDTKLCLNRVLKFTPHFPLESGVLRPFSGPYPHGIREVLAARAVGLCRRRHQYVAAPMTE